MKGRFRNKTPESSRQTPDRPAESQCTPGAGRQVERVAGRLLELSAIGVETASCFAPPAAGTGRSSISLNSTGIVFRLVTSSYCPHCAARGGHLICRLAHLLCRGGDGPYVGAPAAVRRAGGPAGLVRVFAGGLQASPVNSCAHGGRTIEWTGHTMSHRIAESTCCRA
jgi:hypothetical protein